MCYFVFSLEIKALVFSGGCSGQMLKGHVAKWSQVLSLAVIAFERIICINGYIYMDAY